MYGCLRSVSRFQGSCSTRVTRLRETLYNISVEQAAAGAVTQRRK